MVGRFEGLNKAQYEVFEPILPKAKVKKRGRPFASFIKVLNTIIWVLINGAKWASVPKGEQWAPKSTAHDWLGRWQKEGTWEKLFSHVLGMAENGGLVKWDCASVDGSFVPGKGGGEDVTYGYKGKGVTIHIIVDGEGMPLAVTSTAANESERDQVEDLLDRIDVQTGKVGRPKKRPSILQADKGYDSRPLRNNLHGRGIKPKIPQRSLPKGKTRKGRPVATPIDRWKVERTFGWLPRKFRRLAIRWERKNLYWLGFINLAVSMLWIERILPL